MARVKAMVKPELLIWARQSAGLSQEVAAKKVQTKPERIVAWEAGEDRPTIKQLRKLGNAYKRPIAVFYLAKPPRDFQPLRDYRRLPEGASATDAPELLFAVRQAFSRRLVALDLLSELGEEPARFELEASLAEPPDEVAARARKALGVKFEVQGSWSTPYAALNSWREAIERLGVLVFQASVPVAQMRGCSIAERPLPVILVNTQDHPHGRIFSLLHELAHLMLREGGMCQLAERGLQTEERRVEAFCNQVAASTLMPAERMEHLPLVQEKGGADWTDAEIEQIARTFSVSREAAVRRLVSLEKTSLDFYRSKRQQYLAEQQALSQSNKSGGGPPPNVRALSNAGHAFARLVLNSFYQEKITSSDLAEYLEVKLRWVPKIEKQVFGQEQGILAFA